MNTRTKYSRMSFAHSAIFILAENLNLRSFLPAQRGGRGNEIKTVRWTVLMKFFCPKQGERAQSVLCALSTMRRQRAAQAKPNEQSSFGYIYFSGKPEPAVFLPAQRGGRGNEIKTVRWTVLMKFFCPKQGERAQSTLCALSTMRRQRAAQAKPNEQSSFGYIYFSGKPELTVFPASPTGW